MINHPSIVTQGQTGFACPEVHEGTLRNGLSFELYFRHGGAHLELVGAGMRGEASMAVTQPGTADGIFDSDEIRDKTFAVLLPEAMANLERMPT